MKQVKTKGNDEDQILVLTDSKVLERIELNQHRILELLENNLKRSEVPEQAGYISENEAKSQFNRGTTWFWELRNNGFPFVKVGRTIYYKKEDLLQLFEPKTNQR